MPRFIEYNDNNGILKQSLIISFLLVAILFAWQGDLGLNLWDEGFLWYGAQRVLLGEVPIRDFMSYDPGRYYWSAAWMSLWGDNGIMALRFASAVFQILGLAVGLSLVAQSAGAQSRQRIVFLILSALVLLLWMYPRHKLFDVSISIFLVGALSYLVSNPTPHRYFVAGLCLGLAAFFGRNHGLYGLIGGFGVLLWLSWKRTTDVGFLKGFFYWGAGIAVGYLPLILMLLVPGFAGAFFDSIHFQLTRGSTNLPLPVPWPWSFDYSGMSFGAAARLMLVGLLFIALLLFPVLGLLALLRAKWQGRQVSPVLVAAVFLAVPYAHYAFSRADVSHLAQGIFPMLLGCLALLAACPERRKWILSLTLLTISVWVMHVFHPGWQCRPAADCKTLTVLNDKLRIDPKTAQHVALLRYLDTHYAGGERSFIAAPFWPGAYALLDRKSPVWAIYGLWKRGEEFERQEIARIEAAQPAFVLILDAVLDGREDRRYAHTHPLLYAWIQQHYTLLPQSRDPYQIFVPRDTQFATEEEAASLRMENGTSGSEAYE